MIGYGQFCPVAKTAEVFGDRWIPIIMRELGFGVRAFGEPLAAAPLISRTVLAQRLKELAQAGVIHIESKLGQRPSIPTDAGGGGFPIDS
jgi:DNA-binding HxlR family transcriptional regulator